MASERNHFAPSALILAAALAGCGGGGDNPDTAAPTAVPQAAGAACVKGDAFEKHARFASLERARQVLRHRDPWAVQLSDFERSLRRGTTEPTDLATFLNFAADEGAAAWTEAEIAAWRPVVERLSRALAGLSVKLPTIEIVKTTGREEFGFAYTRSTAVVMPPFFVSLTQQPRNAYFFLAHEVFHILSQQDAALRRDLYALLGFTQEDRFVLPAEFESGRVSNPAAFTYDYRIGLDGPAGHIDVVPVLFVPVPLAEVLQLPSFFDVLQIPLMAVDPATGQVQRDASGTPVSYDFGNTDWVPKLSRNTDYIIAADEVLADNFAIVMEWRATGSIPPDNAGSGFPINDVGLLEAVQERLERGCRRS